MPSLSGPVGICGLLLASALIPRALSSSVPIAYCASINTASTSANSSIYQSDGLCYNFCDGSYAYAIVQDEDCWCSDYTPDSGDQVDTSDCDHDCPGYPSDSCGGDSLYGYMSLSNSPSGTKGGSSSTASSTTPATSSTSKSTSTTPTTSTTAIATPAVTTIIIISAPLTTSSASSSSSVPTSTSSKTTASTTKTQTPTVQTVTQGGVVQTVTVTPTSASSSETSAAVTKHHKSVSTGAAVGIAIGVVAGVVMVAAIVFLFWRRKRQQGEKDEALFAATNSPSTRGTSPGTMNGLNVAEAVGAASFRRHGADGSWESDQSGRRRSTLMPIDPRIDPGFTDIYSRTDNKSRDSVNSLRDDHDYSRRVHQPNKVLRATNPDPDDD